MTGTAGSLTTPDEAMGEVQRQIQYTGQYRQPEFSNPLISRAVQLTWGSWQNCCIGPADTGGGDHEFDSYSPTAARRDWACETNRFKQTYTALAERAEQRPASWADLVKQDPVAQLSSYPQALELARSLQPQAADQVHQVLADTIWEVRTSPIYQDKNLFQVGQAYGLRQRQNQLLKEASREGASR